MSEQDKSAPHPSKTNKQLPGQVHYPPVNSLRTQLKQHRQIIRNLESQVQTLQYQLHMSNYANQCLYQMWCGRTFNPYVYAPPGAYLPPSNKH